MPFSDDDLDAFYREIEARTEAASGRHRRENGIPPRRPPGVSSAPPGSPAPHADPPPKGAMSDDDLAAYYREIEARTAARPVRRRTRDRPSRRTALACPTPDKEAFDAEVLARDGITRIRQRSGPGVPLRCYECVCGAWHITSKPVW